MPIRIKYEIICTARQSTVCSPVYYTVATRLHSTRGQFFTRLVCRVSIRFKTNTSLIIENLINRAGYTLFAAMIPYIPSMQSFFSKTTSLRGEMAKNAANSMEGKKLVIQKLIIPAFSSVATYTILVLVLEWLVPNVKQYIYT